MQFVQITYYCVIAYQCANKREESRKISKASQKKAYQDAMTKKIDTHTG
jgi:hypothetical protein